MSVQRIHETPYLRYLDFMNECLVPLKRFGINYFSYKCMFKDNSRIYLGNNPVIYENYYDLNARTSSPLEKPISNYTTGYYYYSALPQPNITLLNILYEQNLGNIFVYIKNNEHMCEFYVFGGSKYDYRINNFYINNLDIIDKFIIYFNTKSFLILKNKEALKIFFESNFITDTKENFNNAINFYHDRLDFMNDTKLPYTVLRFKGSDIRISSRELECICYIMCNKTIKEIGKLLALSPRTIETYLDRLKSKLHCHSIKELIANFYKSNLNIPKNYFQ